MMKISACWITKNEVENIRLSLESVKDIADELIVVDTGSTDDTVSIAESLGARVEYFEWINDFSAARNYAMDLATGDIIIFLDADEWFEPRLSSDDRDFIMKNFSANPQPEMLSLTLNNIADKQSKRILSTVIASRIYLNQETLRFMGKVHEYIPSTYLNVEVSDRLLISHSGYNEDIFADKIRRNIAMMGAALNGASAGSDEWAALSFYLIREYSSCGEYGKASCYLTEMLHYPAAMKRVCVALNESFAITLYAAIKTAFQSRGSVSRRDVYQKLIGLFKATYPNYSGTAEIDLLYQMYFDIKEDRFLEELPPALKAAAAMGRNLVTHYKEYEERLQWRAALATWRRGDNLQAMEYSVAALQGGDRQQQGLFYILLSAMKGQPKEDIVLLLNSVFKTSDPDDLDFLASGSVIDGFRDVHAYYLKKRLDLENAPVGHMLRLLLIYGKYDEAAIMAAEAYAEGGTFAARFLFLAAICGASPALIEAHAAMLEEYAPVLKAYYGGGRLAEVTEADANLLNETYGVIAFVAGLEIADHYRDIFCAHPQLCYLVKAVYCEMGALPEQLLAEPSVGVDPLDFSCKRYRIQAMIHTKRYTEALFEIESFLNAEIIEQDLLHLLLVVAEQAPGETGAKARELYDQYIELYDAMIDIGDVVNTGIVFDDGGKKKRRYFSGMTKAQFDKLLTDEAKHPATKALMELYRKAVGVYKETGHLAEAAHCLVRLLAHGATDKADYGNLAELFGDLRNKELPKYIQTLKETGRE